MAPIVVIDDDRDVLGMVRLFLEARGYQVIEAVDGLSGWQRIETDHPDVVITDARMANLSGLELCRLARTSFPTIKLIVYTAGIVTDEEARQAGADDLVNKSEPLARLGEAVGKASRGAPVG
jgi:CheY-like chemotaxis protein